MAHDPLCLYIGDGPCRLCFRLETARAEARADERERCKEGPWASEWAALALEVETEVRERIAQGVLALWDEQCCGYRNPMKCESCRAYSDVLTHAVGWTSGEQP